MPETDPFLIEEELLPEELEQLAELADAVGDTLENLGEFMTPGDRFPLKPVSFEEAEEFGDRYNEQRLGQIIVLFAMQSLGVSPETLTMPFRTEDGKEWFHTTTHDIVLGTDGSDWWVEFESAMGPAEIEPAAEVAKTRARTRVRAKKAIASAQDKAPPKKAPRKRK